MKKGILSIECDFPECCLECRFFHLRQGGFNDHPSYCDVIPDFFDWNFDGHSKFDLCPIRLSSDN